MHNGFRERVGCARVLLHQGDFFVQRGLKSRIGHRIPGRGNPLRQHFGVQGKVVQAVLLVLTLFRKDRRSIVPGHVVVRGGFHVIANGRAGCGYLNHGFSRPT